VPCRFLAALDPNKIATRNTKIPAVTAYMNVASAMELARLLSKISLSLLICSSPCYPAWTVQALPHSLILISFSAYYSRIHDDNILAYL
jgi:hypothetical protein